MKRMEVFYESFNLVLKSNNIKAMPYQVFKKTSNWTLFENIYKIFDSYMSDNNIQIVEWFAVYNFFFGMIIEAMKESDAVLTPHSILSYSQYLPGIVDAGFPGWVSSGMLPLLIKLIIKKDKDNDNEELL